jgi:dienelactone hydrolase
MEGLHGADFSGLLMLPAAAMFLAAAVLALLDRGRPRSWPRRIGRWAMTAVVGILLLLFVGLPIVIGVAQTQKPAERIDDSALGVRHETVTFAAADGTKLGGWYIPSQNRAAVIVVHGGGGDRTGSIRHARLLSSLGYGVLLYDSRGRGTSEGDPNAQGWTWQDDVAGAIDFVRARPDVDQNRIAGLGLSTGADVLIEAAAKDRALKAVIADGSTVRSLADFRRSSTGDLITGGPYWAVAYGTIEVLDQSTPGPALAKLAGEVPPTPLLLISSNELQEHRWGRIYADAYGPRAELWLTETGHTKALQEQPEPYRLRVKSFLARALR